MKNFNWKKFKTDAIAVHCDTEEKANDFLTQAYEHGFEWEYSNSFLYGNRYGIHLEQTCYRGNGGLGNGDLSYYKERNYKIIEWKKTDFTEADLKVGMLVETKCGDRAILMPHRNGGLVLAYKSGRFDRVTYNVDFTFAIAKVWSPYHCLNFSDYCRTLLWG